MVPVPNLLGFALASALLIAIPGPSVLFVIGRSLALGRRGGLLSVVGNASGLVFIVLALAMDSIWALAAGTARAWFARSPKRLSRLSATGGVMMIGLGGAVAFTSSSSA